MNAAKLTHVYRGMTIVPSLTRRWEVEHSGETFNTLWHARKHINDLVAARNARRPTADEEKDIAAQISGFSDYATMIAAANGSF